MSTQNEMADRKRSLSRRVVRFVLKIFAGLVALIILAIMGFNIYLSSRPAAKTVKAAGSISPNSHTGISRRFIDYMAVSGQRLYTGYASGGMVGVIDTGTGSTVAAITGLGRPHGVAVDTELGLGFTSDSGDNTVAVFDLKTNRLMQKIPVGIGPDAIIYDEKAKLVYVGNHAGKTGTFVDPSTLRVVSNIELGGEPEYPQADPESGVIYQNLEDTSELAVVDPQQRAVVKRFKLAPCEGPTGLVFDAANRRLFSACRSSKNVVMVEPDNGRIVAVLPIGGGVDGVDFDPVLRRAYTANGMGSMTVIQQDSADAYHVLENAPTHFGGHSLVVDPASHRIFVAYFGSVAMYDPLP